MLTSAVTCSPVTALPGSVSAAPLVQFFWYIILILRITVSNRSRSVRNQSAIFWKMSQLPFLTSLSATKPDGTSAVLPPAAAAGAAETKSKANTRMILKTDLFRITEPPRSFGLKNRNTGILLSFLVYYRNLYRHHYMLPPSIPVMHIHKKKLLLPNLSSRYPP